MRNLLTGLLVALCFAAMPAIAEEHPLDSGGAPGSPAAVAVDTFSRSTGGKALWPQTSAEANAGITPAQYYYPPGHGSRYGMDPAAASNTAAFDKSVAAAVAGGYELVIAPGYYYFKTRPAIITNKLTIRADGGKGTVILFRNYNEARSTNGFLTVAPTTEIATLGLRNVYLYANTGTTGGAAISLIASAGAAPDYSRLEGVVVTGLTNGTWAYTLYADGSGRSIGLRDLNVADSHFFNATTALARLTSVINTGFTQVGFFTGAGTSNDVIITGTSSVKTQNLHWMGAYFEDLSLDYARHVVIVASDPVQAITNTANVDYTVIISSHAQSCQDHWDTSTSMLVTPNRMWRNQTQVSDDRGDANRTLTAGVDAPIQRFATTLTADRRVSLSTTGALAGDRFRIVRTGLGAYTLDVGGLKTIPRATAAFVDVSYDGNAWVLTGYGAL